MATPQNVEKSDGQLFGYICMDMNGDDKMDTWPFWVIFMCDFYVRDFADNFFPPKIKRIQGKLKEKWVSAAKILTNIVFLIYSEKCSQVLERNLTALGKWLQYPETAIVFNSAKSFEFLNRFWVKPAPRAKWEPETAFGHRGQQNGSRSWTLVGSPSLVLREKFDRN